MKKGPAYTLSEFLAACRKGAPAVYVQKKRALDTARDQLQLIGVEEILQFVASFREDELTHYRTDVVEKTSDRPPPDYDAYHFEQGFKVYYLAFFKSPSQSRWVLKSLHLDDYQQMENKPFASTQLIQLRDMLKKKDRK